MTTSISSESSPRRVAIIGAGPMGCVLAASFSGAGHEVVLCDVARHLLTPAADPGVRVEGALNIEGKVVRIITSVDALADDPPELIFVTTKATALPLIASAIEHFHKPGIYVISWQNGLDTERVLAEHLGAEWVMRAVVNIGVSLIAPAHVKAVFHQPPHWLQESHESGRQMAETVCRLLSSIGLPTNHADCIVDQIWQKTIMNASISSVCAVTGKTMSQALADAYLRDLVESLIREGITVARANEIRLGWNYFRHSMNYLEGAGNHKPSMLVDIENKRMTEAEYINGQITVYAKIAGLEAPYNKMMRGIVKALES